MALSGIINLSMARATVASMDGAQKMHNCFDNKPTCLDHIIDVTDQESTFGPSGFAPRAECPISHFSCSQLEGPDSDDLCSPLGDGASSLFDEQTGLITLFGGAQDAIQTAAGSYRLKIAAHTEAETSQDCEFTVTVSDWCSEATYTMSGRPEIHSTSLTVSDPETLVLSWDLVHLLLSPAPHENCLKTLQTRFEVSQDGAQY